MSRNYYGFRVDSTYDDKRNFFFEEILQGRLRQGWGFLEGQNLMNQTIDRGANRNRCMLNVKYGDILLIPHIPTWSDVTIVEAVEDWHIGYKFEITQKYGDFGHIFPVKYLCHFNRHNDKISACIRSSLRNPTRFWRFNKECDTFIEKIPQYKQNELVSPTSCVSRFYSSLDNAFSEIEPELTKLVYKNCVAHFQATEWEFALLEGLKLLYPEPYFYIERVGGKSEKKHGSDLLIHIPSICPEVEYGIAIQIKDYENNFNVSEVINQINKANYFEETNNIKVIDRVVIITKSTNKGISGEYETIMNSQKDIRFIFSDDLAKILTSIAIKHKTNNIY